MLSCYIYIYKIYMMKKRGGKFKNRIYIYGLYNLNNIMCRCFKHDLNVFRALKRIKYSFFSFLGNFSKMSFFEHMSSFYFELALYSI